MICLRAPEIYITISELIYILFGHLGLYFCLNYHKDLSPDPVFISNIHTVRRASATLFIVKVSDN